MYAIGVDSGTQGTKVLLVDFDGKVLSRGQASHRFVEGLKPGDSEQDPRVWIKAFEKALSRALKAAGVSPREAACIGVSGQQHGFVPLDSRGVPIRPAKLWNDTSTLEETRILVEKLGGPAEYIQKLGIGLAVGYTASKILWLKRREPENFRKLAHVLLPHNYLNFHLTARYHMEFGDASGTGLMDVRGREWHGEAVHAVDPRLEKALPPLSHPAHPVGDMSRERAEHYGMKTVLVASGGGDNMMGAVGTGNVRSGLCTMSLGTSGTLYAYHPRPFIDPDGEIAAFCDSTGGWLPLLCTMNVTNVTERLKGLLGLSNEELEAAASSAPPGSDGLLFLPYIDGERVPVLPLASGAVFGLNRKNFDLSHLARAAMEGTVFNLSYGWNRMKALGFAPSEIRATGGGARSRLWLQIAADILQTPVVTLQEEEGAALGAAIQSMWNYRLHKGEKIDIQDLVWSLVRTGRSPVEPRSETFPLYRELGERFHSLWQTLREEFQALRRAQTGIASSG